MKHKAMMIAIVLGSGSALFAAPPAKVTPSFDMVAHKFSGGMTETFHAAQPSDLVECFVAMKDSYADYRGLDISVGEIKNDFKQDSLDSQFDLVNFISNRSNEARIVRQYWIKNMMLIEATPIMILEIAQRRDVKKLHHNGTVQLVDGGEADDSQPEWGVEKILADQAWTAGIDGTGIIVGHTDTGVDPNHEALQGKFEGHWHDSINGNGSPYDDHGHGTHTMGTIVGGDGPGPFTPDIGVAPGSTWISAKCLDGSGSGSYAQIMDAVEWVADLKPDVDVRMMSASWSSTDTTESMFFDVMDNYISLNIVPVFAAGNEGSGSGTVGVPGNYPHVLSCGATDSSDNIAGFSSRGPSPSISPWNDESRWLRSDWNYNSPQISAPGVSVYSCLPGGQYAAWNGTSMATPHVAGVIALMCQKNPTLDATSIYNIILDSSDQIVSGLPNNTYGWGRLNAMSALDQTPSMNEPWLTISDIDIDDSEGGDGDGDLEQGETAKLIFTIKNVGGVDAINGQVVLSTEDYFIGTDNELFLTGTLAPEAEISNVDSPMVVSAHAQTPTGHSSMLLLDITSDGGTEGYSSTKTINLQIGPPPPAMELWKEDFEYENGDNMYNHWSLQGDWGPVNGPYHSATHAAYNGGTAFNNFKSMTMTETIDVSDFPEATLVWWQQYDWDEAIFSQAEVQILSYGDWDDIWAYNFVDYPNPLNTYQQVSVPLSSYSSSPIKLKYSYKVETFFCDYGNWWIDDIGITTPDDVEPPWFENMTILQTSEDTGPFQVSTTLTDWHGVTSARVIWRVAGGEWSTVNLSQSGDVWSGYIPSQTAGSNVEYYYEATDGWANPNTGSYPVGAPNDPPLSFDVLYTQNADLNGDGIVNVEDLLLLVAAWGDCSTCIEDINHDGTVGVSDILILIEQWG